MGCKKVFTGTLVLESVEDSGYARITSLEDNNDSCMFVKIQSWDETRQHKEIAEFEGKKVKITVEEVE